MAPKNAISESTTATSRKLVFSHIKENNVIEAITKVVNKSKAVTLSGSDGPLTKRITTNNIEIPIIIIATISTLFTIF